MLAYTVQSNINNRYAAGQKFNSVIFLRDIGDSKMKGAENKNLRMFRKLYGDDNMKNIVLVTTKWNLVSDQGVAEARESQLISEFFEPMIKLGAQVTRDYGTQVSAQAIVRRVLGMPAIDLSVQKQIVDEDRAPKDTDAGKEVEGERAARQKDLENEIADLEVRV